MLRELFHGVPWLMKNWVMIMSLLKLKTSKDGSMRHNLKMFKLVMELLDSGIKAEVSDKFQHKWLCHSPPSRPALRIPSHPSLIRDNNAATIKKYVEHAAVLVRGEDSRPIVMTLTEESEKTG